MTKQVIPGNNALTVDEDGTVNVKGTAIASTTTVSTHAALTTGVHGVGAGTIAQVADIATDGNLSAAAQDAVSKKHSQNTDTQTGALTLLKFAAPTTLTIATGAVTATQSSHVIDTEAAAATDDLDTINGCVDGQIIILRAANDAHSVVIKNGTGNIICGTDCTLDSDKDTWLGIYVSGLSKVLELSRSDNAP